MSASDKRKTFVEKSKKIPHGKRTAVRTLSAECSTNRPPMKYPQVEEIIEIVTGRPKYGSYASPAPYLYALSNKRPVSATSPHNPPRFRKADMATLEEVLAEAQKNNRICPQPLKWQQLFHMLLDKARKGAAWEPSGPLTLAAWWDTSALLKILRLREHIEWADSHGCLEEVNSFLCGLPEDQWHHIGEQ
jgi:hypothetical protein